MEKEEIDLIELLKKIKNSKKKILKTTLLFFFIGVFIAVFSNKEYTASTIILPQTSKGKSISGNLGGLAAMAGINLDNMASESGVSPSLYKKIINSISFKKELLNSKLTISGEVDKISYSDYYNTIYKLGLLEVLQKYTVGLPLILIESLKSNGNGLNQKINNDFVSISEKEKNLIEKLNSQIGIEVNEKQGYVKIYATLPEPLAAAELTQAVGALLESYIISIKTEKAKEKLKFIESRFLERKNEFTIIQEDLALFVDKNQNINSEVVNIKLNQLKTNYELSSKVYMELAKQLEAQKIKVLEDTPVFSVLNPVTIPFQKAKPQRVIIIITWFGLGFFISLMFIIAKILFTHFKSKI